MCLLPVPVKRRSCHVEERTQGKLGDLLALKYHTVSDAAEQLGGVSAIRDQIPVPISQGGARVSHSAVRAR